MAIRGAVALVVRGFFVVVVDVCHFCFFDYASIVR